MVNHKHKYIFIHIPKTAGSSLEVALGGHDQLKYFTSFDHINKEPLQHLTANEIKNKLGKSEYNKYYKFSFVRNPFSRCVSEYFWWRGAGKKNKCGRIKSETSFTQWVHEDLPSLIIENQSIDRLIKHNIEQHKFILDANNDKIVNFVGRFENLQADFDIVCNEIGIPAQKLPHANKTNKKEKKTKHYREYYNDETKKIIEDYYAKDIEYFGYEFEGIRNDLFCCAI